MGDGERQFCRQRNVLETYRQKTRRIGEDVLHELLQHFLKKIFLLPVQVCLFQKKKKKKKERRKERNLQRKEPGDRDIGDCSGLSQDEWVQATSD